MVIFFLTKHHENLSDVDLMKIHSSAAKEIYTKINYILKSINQSCSDKSSISFFRLRSTQLKLHGFYQCQNSLAK